MTSEIQRHLWSALGQMENVALEIRQAIYRSNHPDDAPEALRRVLAAEEAVQLVLNELTEAMIAAADSLPLSLTPQDPTP